MFLPRASMFPGALNQSKVSMVLSELVRLRPEFEQVLPVVLGGLAHGRVLDPRLPRYGVLESQRHSTSPPLFTDGTAAPGVVVIVGVLSVKVP